MNEIKLSLQLVILMALAKGKSAIRTGPVTLHTRTAIHIVELLTQVLFVSYGTSFLQIH